jgi:hypothetical protein
LGARADQFQPIVMAMLILILLKHLPSPFVFFHHFCTPMAFLTAQSRHMLPLLL